MKKITQKNYTGCLLGGAVGDALGAPIEFMSLAGIQERFGKEGVRNYVEFADGYGEFTDDTQMTLFTAEGLIRSYFRALERGIGGAMLSIVHESYLRWLHTQGVSTQASHRRRPPEFDGWLIQRKELHKRRAPGNTCLTALASGTAGTIDGPINNSKGCGTIMRMAPVGLFPGIEPDRVFKVACELSAITHGHPTGYLSAGFFALVIANLVRGSELRQSIDQATETLKKWEHHEETLNAVVQCLELFEATKNDKTHEFATIEQLGGGWIAEEALSISLYCSLLYENDFERGVLYSVNHGGDCDSTGSITGNILGLIHGEEAIPARWIEKLRYAGIVREVAEDLYAPSTDDFDRESTWGGKYPTV